MDRRPWYETAPTVPDEVENGFLIHGRWFPVRNFASSKGEPWPLDSRSSTRLIHLLQEYVGICLLADAEFPIIQAYGHRGTHAECRALDLAPLPGWTVAQMGAVAREQRRCPGSRLRGVGEYPTWLHIDIRPRRSNRLTPKSATREGAV